MKNTTINYFICLVVLAAFFGSPEPALSRTTSYAYNGNNQIIEIDGPRTGVSDLTTYTYYPDGTLATVTNALGHMTTYSNYNQFRRPTVIVDPNGLTTTLSYNGEERIESITLNGVTPSEQRVVHYTYDQLGQLIRVDYNGGVALTGTSISYEYDNARGLTAIEDGAGNRIEFTLDDGGNRTAIVIKATDGDIKKTLSQAFDALGRVNATTDAVGNVAHYNYDVGGNLIETINPRNFATQRSYDALGRVTTVHDAQNATIHYTYDYQNNLTSVTDQRGLTTTYS